MCFFKNVIFHLYIQIRNKINKNFNVIKCKTLLTEWSDKHDTTN